MFTELKNSDKRETNLYFHECNKKCYQKYMLVFNVIENRTISL